MPGSPETPSYRKYIPIGFTVVAVGVWTCKEGLDSLHSGNPTYTLRHTAMQWWESIGVGVLAVVFGVCVISVGLGWIKPRGGGPA
jgi:hypothetical protein